MTQQTPETSPAEPQPAGYNPPEGSPLYARPMSQAEVDESLARLERLHRSTYENQRRIDAAWHSPETQKIRDIVRDDGNVEWPEFVKHCGGILKVITMVDEYGLPDTDKIIPKVDELFNKYAQAEVDAGSVFRRRPSNRPYVAGRGTAAGEALAAAKRAQFPGDYDAREGDVDRLLKEEQEAATLRKRQTHPR
ncbi:hypothetical protein AB0F30_33335 [Streptomyces sp. NPDC029006]|uniref:hypothetical protein n=1 Tax=Streptomyces sp. NPDC029006 TaxID=3155467 RepID=UPI0033DFB93F